MSLQIPYSNPIIFEVVSPSSPAAMASIIDTILLETGWTLDRTITRGKLYVGHGTQSYGMKLAVTDESIPNGGSQTQYLVSPNPALGSAYMLSFRVMTLDESHVGPFMLLNCSGLEQYINACPGRLWTNHSHRTSPGTFPGGGVDSTGVQYFEGTAYDPVYAGAIQIGIPYIHPADAGCPEADGGVTEAWYGASNMGWDEATGTFSSSYSFREYWRLGSACTWAVCWDDGSPCVMDWRMGPYHGAFARDEHKTPRWMFWVTMYMQDLEGGPPPIPWEHHPSYFWSPTLLYGLGDTGDGTAGACISGDGYCMILASIPNWDASGAYINDDGVPPDTTPPLDRVKTNYFEPGIDAITYTLPSPRGTIYLTKPGTTPAGAGVYAY